MNENELRSPRHETIRSVLRVGGPTLVGIGLMLIAISMISFFSAFGGMEPPRFFWCAFLGIPLLAVGGFMCQIGYISDVARYIAAETAPVATQTANYVGEGVQPGVKAMAKAITEGVLEAQHNDRTNS